VATAKCYSDAGVLSKQFPRVMYQSRCNHTVFDAQCTLDPILWTKTVTVTAVSGIEVSVDTIVNYGPGFYTGGTLAKGDDERLITYQLGGALNLLAAISGLAIGDEVDIIPGCNGMPQCCIGRFDNFDHFVGFPYIPTKNVVIWGFR